MDLGQMRTEFKDRASDLEVGLDDPEIDRYLNRAYQFTIPEEVGGEWSEQVWELQLSTGTVEYDYPAQLVGPNGGRAWIESYRQGTGPVQLSMTSLRVETDPMRFDWLDDEDATQQRPRGILLYGRKLTVSHPPDLPYFIKIPSRGGSVIGLQAEGLTHETHAKAVVHYAAADFLGGVEDEMGYAREMREAMTYATRLRRIAQVRPNKRRPARSF